MDHKVTKENVDILNPGARIEVDGNQPFSIRRSGMGTTVIPESLQWTEVPIDDIVTRDIRFSSQMTDEDFNTPITISIGTSYNLKDWDFSAHRGN
jgi:hypothetical protein